MAAPPDLARDLQAAGLSISDPWELVNAKVQYKAAIPVLIDWLRNVEQRVYMPDPLLHGYPTSWDYWLAQPGYAP